MTAPVEIVVKKLAKANIAAFNVKKNDGKVTFQVRDETVKKVFAIFSHPCYNVKERRKSRKHGWFAFACNRCGLFIGGALFLCAVVLSNSFVFKITVTGSGSYLESEVLSIMQGAGVRCGAFFKGLDKPLAQSRIMALPNVTFCSIEKRGSAVIVDVQIDEEHTLTADYKPLVSDADGVVRNLVVVCGTAEAQVGQTVKRGDSLIGAYTENAEGELISSLAVGYAELVCRTVVSVNADEDSEKNAEYALSAPLLYAEEVLEKSYVVKNSGEGVVYEVTFSYLHTVSINMD